MPADAAGGALQDRGHGPRQRAPEELERLEVDDGLTGGLPGDVADKVDHAYGDGSAEAVDDHEHEEDGGRHEGVLDHDGCGEVHAEDGQRVPLI